MADNQKEIARIAAIAARHGLSYGQLVALWYSGEWRLMGLPGPLETPRTRQPPKKEKEPSKLPEGCAKCAVCGAVFRLSWHGLRKYCGPVCRKIGELELAAIHARKRQEKRKKNGC